jgi:hypothetical protein
MMHQKISALQRRCNLMRSLGHRFIAPWIGTCVFVISPFSEESYSKQQFPDVIASVDKGEGNFLKY